MSRVRILVADDFSEWRIHIRSILQTRPEWQVVSEACDGSQAVQHAAELQPDMVLLDIGMPVLNGIEAAKKIHQVSPSSRIIFLTLNNDSEVRSAALATGAEAYVLKTRAASELLPTVEAALCDGQSTLRAG